VPTVDATVGTELIWDRPGIRFLVSAPVKPTGTARTRSPSDNARSCPARTAR